jgi:hypothetical protein
MKSMIRPFTNPSSYGGQPMNRPHCQAESGMTFLEITFAMMLLLLLTMTSANMIRDGIDMRLALSEQGRVTHRLQGALDKISQDLQHAFLLNRQRQELNFVARATKAWFEVDRRGASSLLRLTTTTHKPLREHAKESDQTFVVYQLAKDEKTGLTHLMRGETRVLPQDFDRDVKMRTFIKYIKRFQVLPWTGNRWQEEWNSSKSDFRDTLPQMAEIVIEAWEINPLIEEAIDNEEEIATTTLRTVVYLPGSWGMKEVKEPSSTIKYY